MSNNKVSSIFSFVDDKVLRNNLDKTFFHVVDLALLADSSRYKKRVKLSLLSSLRKTIIIQTAAIIEALLAWKLEKAVNNQSIELSDE